MMAGISSPAPGRGLVGDHLLVLEEVALPRARRGPVLLQARFGPSSAER